MITAVRVICIKILLLELRISAMPSTLTCNRALKLKK